MDTGLLNRHPHVAARNVLFYVGARDCPARQVSLRAIDPERFTIINEAAGGEVMEEIEESKAFFEVYDGAVYLYQVGVPAVLRGSPNVSLYAERPPCRCCYSIHHSCWPESTCMVRTQAHCCSSPSPCLGRSHLRWGKAHQE